MAIKYYRSTLGPTQFVTSSGQHLHFIKSVFATDNEDAQQYLDGELATGRCIYLKASTEKEYAAAMGVKSVAADTTK